MQRFLQALINLPVVVALSLAAAFGFYRAAEAAFEHNPRWYAHPLRWSNHANSLWITRELAGRGDGPALVFAGSSTTRTAYDELIVSEKLGSNWYVENLSNSTTDPCGIYAWLLFLEKHEPTALPDILVQGIEELELQNDVAYHAFHSHLTNYFADGEIFDRESIYHKEMRQPWRRTKVWIEEHFPLYARRSLLQNSVVGSAVWPFYRVKPGGQRILSQRWLSRFHLREYDWNYFRVSRPSNLERRMEGLTALTKDGNFKPERYTFPNAQVNALAATAEFCRRQGILHYAVLMPGVPEKFEQKFWPELTAQLHAAAEEACRGTPTRLIDLWHFLPGEDFFDSLHISQTGRGPVSRVTAEVIRNDIVARHLPWPYRRGEPLPSPPREQLHEIAFTTADRDRYAEPADADRKR